MICLNIFFPELEATLENISCKVHTEHCSLSVIEIQPFAALLATYGNKMYPWGKNRIQLYVGKIIIEAFKLQRTPLKDT